MSKARSGHIRGIVVGIVTSQEDDQYPNVNKGDFTANAGKIEGTSTST